MSEVVMSSFLTKEEVAVMLKLSLATIDRHIKTGALQHVKIGSRIRFSRDYIESLSTKKA